MVKFCKATVSFISGPISKINSLSRFSNDSEGPVGAFFRNKIRFGVGKRGKFDKYIIIGRISISFG